MPPPLVKVLPVAAVPPVDSTPLPSSATGEPLGSQFRSSVNFAARNLHVWTKYRGLDPEIDFQSGVSNNGAPQEFQSMGTPTYFIFRLNLGF